MVQLNVKVPQEVLDRLEKRAKRLTKGSPVKVTASSLARGILTEHA